VERILGLAAMRGRIGQGVEDLQEFNPPRSRLRRSGPRRRGTLDTWVPPLTAICLSRRHIEVERAGTRSTPLIFFSGQAAGAVPHDWFFKEVLNPFIWSASFPAAVKDACWRGVGGDPMP
jgi:hypothetical protein